MPRRNENGNEGGGDWSLNRNEIAFDANPNPGFVKKEQTPEQKRLDDLRMRLREARDTGNRELIDKYMSEIKGLGSESPKELEHAGEKESPLELPPGGPKPELLGQSPEATQLGEVVEREKERVRTVVEAGERRVAAAGGDESQVRRAHEAGGSAITSEDEAATRARGRIIDVKAIVRRMESAPSDTPRDFAAEANAAREKARRTNAPEDWAALARITSDHINSPTGPWAEGKPSDRGAEVPSPRTQPRDRGAESSHSAQHESDSTAHSEHGEEHGDEHHSEGEHHGEELEIPGPELSDNDLRMKKGIEDAVSNKDFDFKTFENPDSLAAFLMLKADASPEERLRRIRIAFDAAVEKLAADPIRRADMQQAIERGNAALEARESQGGQGSQEREEREEREEEVALPENDEAIASNRLERLRKKISSESPEERRLRESSENDAQAREGFKRFLRVELAPVKDVVDRIRLMWNERLFRNHDERAQMAYLDVVGLNDKITEAEAKVRQAEAKREGARAGMRGAEAAKIEADAEADRRKATVEIEKLKAQQRKAQSKLKEENRSKVTFENERKRIAKGYMERVGEQLQPYEKEIREAKEKRDEFDAEIQEFNVIIERHEEELHALEEGLKDAWDKEDQLVFRAAIREVREGIATGRKAVKLRLGERDYYERELAKLEEKTDPWRAKMNELALLSRREEAYHIGGVSDEEVEPDWAEAGRGRGPRDLVPPRAAESPSRIEVPQEGPPTENSRPESSERNEKMWDPALVVERWNRLFGSDMRINSDVLFGRLEASREPASFREQAEMIIMYWRAARKVGRTNIAEKKAREDLRTLLSVLEFEEGSE